MKNELELKPKMDELCKKFIEFSKKDVTAEQELLFYTACYNEVKDYFEDEREFLIYLNECLKEYLTKHDL